jgi:hypothetical protein
MRKFNFENLSLCLLVISLFSLIQCKKDTESFDNDVVRSIIQLTTSDITTFNGMTQIGFGDTPWSVQETLPGIYTPIYEYRWDSDGDDFAIIDIWVADSKNLAFDILKEKQKSYTIPTNLLEQRKDIPAVVGDLSYFKGLEFIRDNFIVRINTSESFKNSISEIAKCVDSKILKSPTYNLATQIKPVIKNFKLSKNPVSENTKTALIIQVDDPNNKAIVYQWSFDKSSGYGGITKDDSGIYYYNSSWVESNNITIGLTLIATNELGFCTDSTIYIQTIKE